VQDVRPVLVLVEKEGSDLGSPSRLLQSRYRVVTCPVESVALEYVSESPPAAVLQDASALYLEGPEIVQRWKSVCPETRVLFLDADGPWGLLMEPEDPDSGMVRINPCVLQEVASAVEEMLHGDGVAAGKEVQDGRMAILVV
jgi:hypothetical protein